MTEEELSEIDDKVSEAIGRDPYEARLNGFMPSTDWNDAMFAAEKAGLWDWNVALRCADGTWVVDSIDQWGSLYCDEAKSESGPLCICQAILKLKGQA